MLCFISVELGILSISNLSLLRGVYLQVWELQEDDEGVGYVQHLSELSRHDCAVNAVRFHPSDDLLATASDGIT